MAQKIVKMEPLSLKLTAIAFAIILFILGLAGVGADYFGLSDNIINIVMLIAVIIFFNEIHIMSILKKRGKGLGLVTSIELIIGALVALSVILGIVGVEWSLLIPFQGWMAMIFGLGFFIETFVR